MIDIDNQSQFTINSELLQKIHTKLSDKHIELLFVEDAKMQELNTIQREIQSTTDVLSFPLEVAHSKELLGSIVINGAYAQRSAQQLGHTFEKECAVLFLHGLLHLLGYDHECDNGEMAKLEANLQATFDLPQTLIQRTLDD